MKALIDFLGGLKLAGGDRDGEAFTVLPWERRFIRGAFAGPGDSAIVGRTREWKKLPSWRVWRRL